MPSKHAVAFFLVLFVAEMTSLIQAAPPQSKPSLPPKKGKPTPQVLIIPFEDYPGERRLKQPIASSLELTTKLLENGYGVTILTSTGSKQKVQDALKEKAGTSFATADKTQDVIDQIADWRSRFLENPNSNTPFGFVVFAGHGQSRQTGDVTQDYLLTPGDDLGQSGVCIQNLADEFGKRMLPVVFIVDMCRLLVTEQALAEVPADQPKTQRSLKGPATRYDAKIEKGKLRTFNNPQNGAVHPILTLWSAQADKAANDSADESGDFLLGLALGLQRSNGTFAARDSRTGNRNAPKNAFSRLENPQDLSLFTWFTSAALYVHEAHNQQAELSPGLLDPMMICASTRPNFSHMTPALDMLTAWDKFPATSMFVRNESNSVVIERPANAPLEERFSVSFFRDRSLPWQGNSLLVEAIAETDKQTNLASVGCLINPGDNSVKPENGKPSQSLVKDWNTKVFDVPFNAPRRFVLPLSGVPGQEFRSLAVAVPASDERLWPEEMRIRITRLAIINSQTGAVVVGTNSPTVEKELELLPRLWSIESKIDNEQTRVASTFERTKGNRPVWNLAFTGNLPDDDCGQGGSLFRVPYVSPSHVRLRVTINSISPLGGTRGQDAKIIIQGHDYDQNQDYNLLVGNLPQTAETKTVTYEFARSGFPERLYIMSTNLAEIKISDISLFLYEPAANRKNR